MQMISLEDLPPVIRDKLVTLEQEDMRRQTEYQREARILEGTNSQPPPPPGRSFAFQISTQAAHPGARCQLCGDGGWVQLLWSRGQGSPTRPSISPVKNAPKVLYQHGLFYVGTEIVADCILCNNNVKRMNALWRASNLQPHEQAWRLEFYEDDIDGKIFAVNAARSLLESLPKPVGWTFLYGGYGVGKTGLLKCITAAAIRAGTPARYITAEDFITAVRDSYSDGDVTETAVFEQHLSATVLCIDEVDPDRMTSTSHGLATVFALLNKRYESRFSCATVIASNRESGDLWGYLESRLLDSERIEVGGKVYRGA